MSEKRSSFTGILTDADDGERITLKDSPIGEGAVRLTRPGRTQEPIDLWVEDLKSILSALEEWWEE